MGRFLLLLLCFRFVWSFDGAKECTLLVAVSSFENAEETISVECEINGQYIPLSWDQMYIESILNNPLISGLSQLDLSNLEIRDDILQVPENSDLIYNRRRLQVNNSTGIKTVLVVRVVSRDASPLFSVENLWDVVFEDQVNLKKQYTACSYGQLSFIPGRDGVMEVVLPINVKNVSRIQVQNAVTNVLGGFKPVGIDFVMYCIPPGTKDGWIAYAYVNSWLSVYNDKWCGSVSAQMHEVGHNLGLGHANERSIAYEDQSGYMGYGYNENDSPLMCFNAFHSWKLGWYKNKTINLVRGGTFSGILSGYVDFPVARQVLLHGQLNTGGGFFISFNKKQGFNNGTRDGENRVNVVTVPREDGYVDTNLVAKMNEGERLQLFEWLIEVKKITSRGAFVVVAPSSTPSPLPRNPTPSPLPRNPTPSPLPRNPTPSPLCPENIHHHSGAIKRRLFLIF